MRGLKSSIYYWEYSLRNPDPFPDPYYVNDYLIVEDSLLLEGVERLRELISAYCTLRRNNLEKGRKELLSEIEKNLVALENVNYTEFVAYWKSLDMQYGTFLEFVKEEKEMAESILEELLDKYCRRREELYRKFGYTHTTVQALYDSGSSRSKGHKFKRKIEDIVSGTLEVEVVEFSESFEQGLVFITRKNWPNIKESLGLKYPFGASHQSKIPDFYLKFKGYHLIGEAKHIHNTGGAQDKQIAELIEFIRQKENKEGVHYLAFLDGLYMQRFSKESISEKLYKQKLDIEKALRENPKNFFVNGNGFKKLLGDLKSE